jgi:predicted RNase H-like HicB family nuclease
MLCTFCKNLPLFLFMKFNVVLEPAEEGGFVVSVPALDGCFTEGNSEAEALENAKEAILCYLEGLEKLNEIKGKPGITIRGHRPSRRRSSKHSGRPSHVRCDGRLSFS